MIEISHDFLVRSLVTRWVILIISVGVVALAESFFSKKLPWYFGEKRGSNVLWIVYALIVTGFHSVTLRSGLNNDYVLIIGFALIIGIGTAWITYMVPKVLRLQVVNNYAYVVVSFFSFPVFVRLLESHMITILV